MVIDEPNRVSPLLLLSGHAAQFFGPLRIRIPFDGATPLDWELRAEFLLEIPERVDTEPAESVVVTRLLGKVCVNPGKRLACGSGSGLRFFKKCYLRAALRQPVTD